MNDKIEKTIDEIVEDIMNQLKAQENCSTPSGEEVEEVSTSSAAGGYLTPKAFGKTRKSIAQVAGYKIHPDTDDDGDGGSLNEDVSLPPARKIGLAISEINKQIAMIENAVNNSVKLKNESHMGSQNLWKRTAKTLTRLESKLLRVAKQIRELKG